ncbi:MAG: hypothetical protein WBP81_26300 [Solirubrobacteraceae bacterium]
MAEPETEEKPLRQLLVERRWRALPPLEGLWAYSLAPLLSEYLAGSASQQRERILRELREVFLAAVEK